VAVRVDGVLFARYSADAVIAATPTGSTAYTFSAGGPVVSPRVESLLVTPVAPHGTFNRALLVHPQERLELELLPQGSAVVVEVDGVAVGEIEPGTRIPIQPSALPALVVRLGGTSFVERAREKLGVSDSQALGDP
jgi:NAD+ kinase